MLSIRNAAAPVTAIAAGLAGIGAGQYFVSNDPKNDDPLSLLSLAGFGAIGVGYTHLILRDGPLYAGAAVTVGLSYAAIKVGDHIGRRD